MAFTVGAAPGLLPQAAHRVSNLFSDLHRLTSLPQFPGQRRSPNALDFTADPRHTADVSVTLSAIRKHAVKRLRNIAAIALVAGIAVGVWLADWFKGLGSGDGVGLGQRGLTGIQTSTDGAGGTSATTPANQAKSPGEGASPSSAGPTPKTVSLVISDRAFLLRTAAGDQPVTLQRILQLVAETPGDDDGCRVKIARSASSRTSTELELQDALKQAGIPESAIYWKPGIVE